MSITINLTDNEQMLVNNYAKLNSMTVEQVLKSAIFEMIEDKADLLAAEEAYKEFMEDPVTYSHDEAWAEIMRG